MKRNLLFSLGMMLVLVAACAGPAGNPAGGDAYTVTLTAADFVERIDNPYLPFLPGSKWVYEATLEDGTVERNEIEVLQETRAVNGVAATVVHDTVFVGGQLVEETYDWYAQDKDGNVWYLGE
jgi:hypothetical protein